MRPFLVLILGLATVSTKTYRTKVDEALDIDCPMPDDGEKLQVCSWRMEDEGEFKSSLEKANGNRISTKINHSNCMIRIDRVEEEDEGIWECEVRYQTKDGDAVSIQKKIVVEVADVDLELNLSMPKDGEKLQVCSWRNGDEGAFKSSFRKSHGDRISVYQNESACNLRFSRVGVEDLGIWQGKIVYLHLGSIVEILKESTVGLNSSKKGLSMEKLSGTKVEGSSLENLKTSTAGPKETLEKLSTTNSKLENKSQKHSSLKKSSREGCLSAEKLTNNSSALIKIDEKATNLTSENINSGSVKEHKLVDVVFWILYIVSSVSLGAFEKITPYVPFNFAYSVALSPSVAAGASGSGEFGIALGSNGDILVFSSHCLGVKSDLSLEFDVVVGAWSSINDITGRNYAIGLGTDTAEFLNEYGNDETGGNFKIVYNKDKFIGGTLSLGYGHGYDLPIDNELTYDICHSTEIMRLHWRKIFNRIKNW